MLNRYKPIPIRVDFANIRLQRQSVNNANVHQSILSNDQTAFYRHVNQRELERTLSEMAVEFGDFWNKCVADDMFARLASGRLAKCSSRQGSFDEVEQLNTCNATSSKCGVIIENLSATALRPTKQGDIITDKEMKRDKISKTMCLKSFDGRISGKCSGFVSAKVAFGSGGHQDNVFEEMDVMGDWWCKFRATSPEIIVLLIDTNLAAKFATLKKKYEHQSNILIMDHVEFQQFIIDTYYEAAST